LSRFATDGYAYPDSALFVSAQRQKAQIETNCKEHIGSQIAAKLQSFADEDILS